MLSDLLFSLLIFIMVSDLFFSLLFIFLIVNDLLFSLLFNFLIVNDLLFSLFIFQMVPGVQSPRRGKPKKFPFFFFLFFFNT